MSTPSSRFADTIYLNGVVLTMDAKDSQAEALAIAQGRIQAVGLDSDIKTLAGPKTKVVDLKGQTLLPGFIDPHSHFPLSGLTPRYRVDLRSPPVGTRASIEEIVVALKEKADQTPAGEWVKGSGYDDTMVKEMRHPNRHDLDRVSTVHPVWVTHCTGHHAACNSLALERAGITKDTPQPPGGVIRMDPETGEPLGVFEEGPAMQPIKELMPPVSNEQMREVTRIAAAEYASQGVTTAQNAACDQRLVEQLIHVTREGVLPIRTVFFPQHDLAMRITRGEYQPDIPAGDLLIQGAAKIFADGAIQGFTGYLSKPYHTPFQGDAAYRGYPIYTREELTDMVVQLHQAGWQIGIHGNGDAAIDDIIAAHQAAQKACPREDARHIVIHSQMVREDQLDQYKTLGLTPSFFSLHVYYWGDRHKTIFIGPERAVRISPAQSAVKRGIRFTIHCDTDVVPMTPLLLMSTAVNRITHGEQVLGPEQCITPLQALKAHTIDAAWQVFQEDRLGSLEPGKFADLVVLDRNPLDDPKGIKDIQVMETIVGGQTVFRAD